MEWEPPMYIPLKGGLCHFLTQLKTGIDPFL